MNTAIDSCFDRRPSCSRSASESAMLRAACTFGAPCLYVDGKPLRGHEHKSPIERRLARGPL